MYNSSSEKCNQFFHIFCNILFLDKLSYVNSDYGYVLRAFCPVHSSIIFLLLKDSTFEDFNFDLLLDSPRKQIPKLANSTTTVMAASAQTSKNNLVKPVKAENFLKQVQNFFTYITPNYIERLSENVEGRNKSHLISMPNCKINDKI